MSFIYIALDCKWHRFDFEYRIPPQLPSSIVEKEGRYTYYATALIHQPHGPDMETHEVHFRVCGRLDVDSFPSCFRSPVERKEEMYRSVVEEDKSRHQMPSDNDSASVFLQEPEEDVLISAGLRLNRRLFVPGDRLAVDGSVTNRTPVTVTCAVKFQQVLAYLAEYGLERRSRRSPLYQHYRSNLRLVERDLVPRSSSSSSKSSSTSASPSAMVVPPGKTRNFSCQFEVPRVPPSTQTNLIQPIAEMNSESSKDVLIIDDRHPLIRYKYFCKLEVIPQWAKPNKLVIPVEIKICSHRTLRLSLAGPSASVSSRRSSRRSSSGAAGGSSSNRDAETSASVQSHHHHFSREASTSGTQVATSALELSVFDIRNEPTTYADYFRETRHSTPSTARCRQSPQVV